MVLYILSQGVDYPAFYYVYIVHQIFVGRKFSAVDTVTISSISKTY